MKKYMLLITASLMVGALVTGCGSPAEGNTDTNTPPSASTPEGTKPETTTPEATPPAADAPAEADKK
ncbi:MAG: hypothetical protein QE269_12105 [Fimbriimonas sp.]|jgi:hypothetical protein|nr:hypothetical protein [Fimbriimonas sp.]